MHLQHLTDDAAEAVVDLMMLCERLGYALGVRAVLLGLFLAKADGGTQAVSLMTKHIRLCEAVQVEQDHL